MSDSLVGARAKARVHLTDAQRHGLTFWDAIADALYRGGRDDEERFKKKIRRKRDEAKGVPCGTP